MLRYLCAIFKQKHRKKRRIFILSWLWAQKNVCHSRTKCKFSIFLSILLGVFEAQVTVDRWRAVILRVGVAKRCKYCQKLTFCKKKRRTRSRPECDFPTCAVACVCSCSLENPQSKACGKNLGKTWVKSRFWAICKEKHWKNIGKNDGFSSWADSGPRKTCATLERNANLAYFYQFY